MNLSPPSPLDQGLLHLHADKIRKLSIPTPAFTLIHESLQGALDDYGKTAVPECIHIIGHSRSGKSFAVREFEARFPVVRTALGLTKEVIYVQAPVQGTIKGLMEALLEALGDPCWSKGSYSDMLGRLIVLLRAVGCKMIIIDEFQHLADKGQKARLKGTTDWLKMLVERDRFCLVCVGLPDSSRIIRGTEQLRTRFDSTLRVPVYDWRDELSRRIFCGIVRSIHNAMAPFEVPNLSSDLLSLRLFIACGGRMGLLAKIFDRAVKNAVREQRTQITLEHLDQAFRRAVWYADEIKLDGGPFFVPLTDDSASSVCMQAMQLAESAPVDEEDRQMHLGSLQGRTSRPRTKKRIRQELTKVLG